MTQAKHETHQENAQVETELPLAMAAVLHDMQECMSGEVNAIRSQTAQIQSLLVDAIATLHETFAGIHESSAAQMKVMTTLMMDITDARDEQNIFQKAEHAGHVLKGLMDTMMLSSRNNLRALTSMDQVRGRMQTMAEMCNERRAVVEELLAAAGGDAVPGEVVRRLGGELLQLYREQEGYTGDTLKQFRETHRLVDEIASRDMDDVFASKTRVEEILDHFFSINEMVSDTRVQVNQVNADLRQHLGAAIRALQFEDISSQSLGHTGRHLDRMQGMIAILVDGLKELEKPGISVAQCIEHIAGIHRAMTDYHQTLRLEDSNPISQENMDEGDVDLF